MKKTLLSGIACSFLGIALLASLIIDTPLFSGTWYTLFIAGDFALLVFGPFFVYDSIKVPKEVAAGDLARSLAGKMYYVCYKITSDPLGAHIYDGNDYIGETGLAPGKNDPHIFRVWHTAASTYIPHFTALVNTVYAMKSGYKNAQWSWILDYGDGYTNETDALNNAKEILIVLQPN